LFTFVHAHQDRLQDRQRWILPLEGRVSSGLEAAVAGECLLVSPGQRVEFDRARVLIGAKA
jgi:hypothetical protein